MSKYQFKVNGQVVSAKDLYEHNLMDYMDSPIFAASILGDLLQGKVVELDDFSSDNSVDFLQLVEVK